MPIPSSSLATQRPDIAQSLEEFDLLAERQNFVGNRVLPFFGVGSQAGNFGKIPLEQLLQNADTKRAPGSGYARGSFQFETATYATEEHGWEEPIDDRERQMFAEYFDAQVLAANRAMGYVLRNAEKRIADAVFNTTTWTGASLTTGVTNEWDDSANATPIDDVEAAVQKVWDNSGLWPNALIVNRKVFRNLRNVDQITDRIAASGAGDRIKASDVTAEMLARVFDLDQVIVAGGAQNTAAEGQSASISSIWSDEYAMVARVATNPADFREPCIGRTFHWAGDGSSEDGRVETYRSEERRADIVRVRHDVDEVILYPQAGHLLSNITT